MNMNIKKTVLILITVLYLLCMLTSGASAESAEEDASYDLYEKQYEVSGAADLESQLPEETSELLNELGIDLKDPENLFDPEAQNIFAVIWQFISGNAVAPLKATLSVIGLLLIFASVDGLMTEPPGNGLSVFICFVSAITLLEPVYSLISSVESAVKGMSAFMLSFIPVFAGITLSLGNTSAGSSFSALLLGAAEGISQFISFVFLPISSGCICLGVCGCISPIPTLARICEWIKKCALWLMGIATTIFLSILSVQTSVTAAADDLGIRTSKALLSSSIPVMGSAIAETLNTARGCLTLLRSGVGIYGAAAVALLALPIIAELLLWRFSMWICSGVAEIFGMRELTGLFRSVDFGLTILVGATAFTALLFIISMTVGMKIS